jgi:GTP-binding protein
MIIKNAEFLISVADKNQILDLGLNEFVFVGRSNVGKSSLINFLTNKKNLAKTSSTPGLTKLINYFLINNTNKNKIIEQIKNKETVDPKYLDSGFLLIDLPGYGFSKSSKAYDNLWSDLIENYFKTSKNIKKILVLVDIRHEPSPLDIKMIQYLYFNKLPFVVIATKADKIAKTKIKNYVDLLARNLKLGSGNIIPCSVETKLGREEILSIFDYQE